jgi:hypothetical protein
MRLFIAPDGIDGACVADGNGEVAAIALIRAVGRVLRPLQEPHVHVLARNVEDGRIGCFLQRQGRARIGDDMPGERHDDPVRVARDRDRMIGAGNFDLLCGCAHVVTFAVAVAGVVRKTWASALCGVKDQAVI